MRNTKRLAVAVVIMVALGSIAVWAYVFIVGSRVGEVQFVPGTLVVKSHDAILGAIGYKQQTQEIEKPQWFFERMTIPAWKSLDVYNAGAITRSESQIRQLEKLGLSSVSRAWLETSGKHDSSRGYKVVTLQIRDSEGIARELLELSKNSPYLRSILRQGGVRIVREVDQVFDHKTTEQLKANTGASATLAKARDTDVQLSFGAEQSSTVTLSDGSVISYRLALLCWSPEGALQLRLDQGVGCPAGFSETLPDAVKIADGVNEEPTPPRHSEPATPPCPNIAGTWIREMDGVKLLFAQDVCTISAEAPTGPFAHSFRGLYTDDHFQYVVKRTNNANGCMTRMFGNIEMLTSDRIRVVVAATDGKCDLPANFWEDLFWRRESAVNVPVPTTHSP